MNQKTMKFLKHFNSVMPARNLMPVGKFQRKTSSPFWKQAVFPPAHFGFEPWKFLILKNQTLKDRLFPVAAGGQNSLRGASLFVIYLARKK